MKKTDLGLLQYNFENVCINSSVRQAHVFRFKKNNHRHPFSNLELEVNKILLKFDFVRTIYYFAS